MGVCDSAPVYNLVESMHERFIEVITAHGVWATYQTVAFFLGLYSESNKMWKLLDYLFHILHNTFRMIIISTLWLTSLLQSFISIAVNWCQHI